jgi:RNA polymerase sigma-70 factor, ECF subfamily
MELTELVLKAKQGNEAAFCRLIEARKADIYKIAFCYVKNKEDALDIVSETVFKAYVSLPKLRQPEYFNTWLTRILINCALTHLKHTRPACSLDEEAQRVERCSPAELPGGAAEARLDLYRALDKLDDKHKTVVILKYFQDLTLPEVAEILKCPVGTVKTYLHRALKTLRVELKEEY